MRKNKKVLIGVCGGIAVYKVCDLIRELKKQNFEVICIMTKEATKFITSDILQYLSGNKVYIDLFDLPRTTESHGSKAMDECISKDPKGMPQSHMCKPGVRGLPNNLTPAHIYLSSWADIVVVIPATAHIIAKLSHGLGDCLLSCTILATTAPILICPAMHVNMYKNKIVQENIRRLRSKGFSFIGPKKGKLLNGKVASGHLEDVKVVINRIKDTIR